MTNKTMSRREMLRRTSTVAAISAMQMSLPRWMPRLAFAPKYQAPRGDVLVVVFLRGGADALNMIVPHGEDAYYNARPQLAIARPDTSGSDPKSVDLDGFFGLHPAMASLTPIFQAGDMTAVHAAGSTDPSRSHFEAMSFMERGTPGDNTLSTGWVGRHLALLDTGNASPMRAVGWGTAAQEALRGPISPVAIKSIADYHLGGRLDVAAQMMESINALYSLDTEDLYSAAESTKSAVEVVAGINIDQYQTNNNAVYPENDFALGLMQTAALIRADVGLEAACLDLGGWDTHANQGASEGTHAQLMTDLAEGLAAFYADMTADMDRITVVVMSEFGRRVKENANFGTDHGHGGVMFVMNGNLQPEPIYALWPGLEPDYLDRGDLAITTDYRDVLATILTQRLNNPGVAEIFPNHRANTVPIFG